MKEWIELITLNLLLWNYTLHIKIILMMKPLKSLLETISYAIHKKTEIHVGDQKINFKALILEFQFLKLSKNIRN